MMTMSLIFFLLFSMVHVSLICCTKLLTNYAAWASARVWAVNEDDARGKAQQAGVAILEILRFGPIDSSFINHPFELCGNVIIQPGNGFRLARRNPCERLGGVRSRKRQTARGELVEDDA